MKIKEKNQSIRLIAQPEELKKALFGEIKECYDYDALREMYVDLATIHLELYTNKSEKCGVRAESVDEKTTERALLTMLYRDVAVFCSTLEHHAAFNPKSIRFNKLLRFLQLHRENLDYIVNLFDLEDFGAYTQSINIKG